MNIPLTSPESPTSIEPTKVIENTLLQRETQSIISIISYSLLIFTTVLIGYGIIKEFKIGKYVIPPTLLKSIATFALAFIWILLLSVEGIRLRRILNNEKENDNLIN